MAPPAVQPCDLQPQCREPDTVQASRPPVLTPAPDRTKEAAEPSLNITDDGKDDTGIASNPFAFTPAKLHALITTRTTAALDTVGGVRGLAVGLRTYLDSGLSPDEGVLDGTISLPEAIASSRESRPATPSPLSRESHHQDLFASQHEGSETTSFSDRTRIFGTNVLPRRKQKSFLRLAWIAFNDKLIMLLSVSAVISLALGIYQSVDRDAGGSKIEWVDGVTVVVAIFVIVFASAATDWQKNRKFEKLNERKEQRDVTVVRAGTPRRISVYGVLVGDMMRIEAGDIVPVDGVLVQAAGVQINESSISGESELVHKHAASVQCPDADPFILSGTTVAGGYGTYLVTSVGVNSTYGRTLMSLRHDVEETPLQQRLGKLAKQLITIGAIAGLVFFIVIFIRWLVEIRGSTLTPPEKAKEFFELLILAVTVVVITVPEGLALAVTIALAFATSRMLKDNNLVRLIRSCEIMGNATCICSDKTGTLTRNDMIVVVGMVGPTDRFSDLQTQRHGADLEPSEGPLEENSDIPGSKALAGSLSPEVKQLIKENIALNSTAFESDAPNGTEAFIGSSTETALLKFARKQLAMVPLNEERANNEVLEMVPFDSSRKWMAATVRLSNGRSRLFVKGAAEIVLDMSSTIVSDPRKGLQVRDLAEADAGNISRVVHDYALKMLRPIGLAYKDLAPGSGTLDLQKLSQVEIGNIVNTLTFVGVFGIQDPLRPEAINAVRQCQNAGVFVRMVTGDSFLTAKAIASECGIYTPGGLAMDGPTFRRLTPSQLDLVIPRLQVLARSSPEDKLRLVKRLKSMGETVAVTGDGTNDALALKEADVGFAMGVQGTEVAKEAASIILLDDNFDSIVKALSWGRTVNAAVKKFLQFQFTINITAGTLTVVSTLAGDTIFTVVQLLWINLIMDIFASLGLATDYPSPDFLRRRPEPRTATIVNITMWKMILCQAAYQLAVVFTLHYAGLSLFTSETEEQRDGLQTMVFNTFVFMQLFNQHNCRRVDNGLNIYYQGVLRNPWFLGVQCVTLAGQMVIVWKGGEAFDTHPPTGAQWGWTVAFGVLTIPLGMLVRQVPDEWVRALFRGLRDGFMALVRPFRGLVPERLRKGKQEEKGVEGWVLRTGSTLLRPVNYHLGAAVADRSTEGPQAGTMAAIPMQSKRDEAPDLEAAAGDRVDLMALITASRAGEGHVNRGLEEHPGTRVEDLALLSEDGRKSRGLPSQDRGILRSLGLPV